MIESAWHLAGFVKAAELLRFGSAAWSAGPLGVGYCAGYHVQAVIVSERSAEAPSVTHEERPKGLVTREAQIGMSWKGDTCEPASHDTTVCCGLARRPAAPARPPALETRPR